MCIPACICRCVLLDSALKCWVYHCLESVLVQSFSGPCFPAFGFNADIYRENLRIQSERGKIQPRKTLNIGTFHEVHAMAEKVNFWKHLFSADIYLLRVNNCNTRTRREICSKLTIKTSEQCHTWTTPLALFWCLYC